MANNNDEWNILDKSESDFRTPTPDLEKGNYSMFGGLSCQIVEILNNKLFDISSKIDTIIQRMDELEKKIDYLTAHKNYDTESDIEVEVDSRYLSNNTLCNENTLYNVDSHRGLKFLIKKPDIPLPVHTL